MTGSIVHSGGLVTPLGLTAPSTCAALRAGLQRFGELRFLDEAGEWLRGAEIELTDTITAEDKLRLCLAMAVEESLGDDLAGSTSEIPLLVCTAEPSRAGRWRGLGEGLLEDVQARIGLRFHKASRTFARGRVGALDALRAAADLLSHGTRYVLVAGCDSYLSAATLQSMERRRRLLTSVHSDGFIPGEAAAAVLVASSRLPGRPAVRLAGLGAGEEPAPVESGEPLRADGLVAALRAALASAGANLAEVDYRLIGANGESYFFREASLAQTRLMRQRRETPDPSDEDVAIPSDSALPWPEPDAVARWWRAHAGEFAAGRRYLAGAPISREGLHRALREGKQRQRLAAAEELKILTRAGLLFECRSKASPSRPPAP